MIEPNVGEGVGSGTKLPVVLAVAAVVSAVDAMDFVDVMEAKALESIECAAGPGWAVAHKCRSSADMTYQLK